MEAEMTHEQFLRFEEDCDREHDAASERRLGELLEYADRCLLGQMAQDGDPPDGVVVNIQATGTVYVEEANMTIRCHRNIAGLCADCGKGACYCRYCDSCSQLWVSPHIDEPDENGHQEEQCPECDYWLAQDPGLTIQLTAQVQS